MPRPSVCLGHLAVISSLFCSPAAFEKWIPIASSLIGRPERISQSLCAFQQRCGRAVESGQSCVRPLLPWARSCSCFSVCFCEQSEAAQITSKANSENLQDPFQSAGRPRVAGRLLPEPGGLVLPQCPQRGPWDLCLPLERLY